MAVPKILKNFSEGVFEQENERVFKNTQLARETLERASKRLMVIICGPTAGSGKDALIQLLIEDGGLRRVRTVTTRDNVREDEKKDDPYIRLSETEFKKGAENSDFLEWIEINGIYYGTRKQEIAEALDWEAIPLLRQNTQGGARMASFCRDGVPPVDQFNVVSIVVTPPTLGELEGRFKKREGKTTQAEADFNARIQYVREHEIEPIAGSHFVVINYDQELEEAVEAVREIVARYRT